MWIFKYMDCLIHGHTVTEMVCQSVNRRYHYYYCLRCGRLTPGK